MTDPEALEQALRSGLDALGLPADDDNKVRLLLAYLRLLERWNRVYNLTSVRDPADMLTQHLLDSLAVVQPLRRHWAQHPRGQSLAPRLLDVGSGGGLPGVVIAIMNPEWAVTCIDAVGKKAAFIQQVAAELMLPRLHAAHGRVEHLKQQPVDIVTARAFSSLADLTRLTSKLLLLNDGCWVAMKGQQPDAELAALPGNVAVFHVEPLSVPDLKARRCLVWMRPTG